MNPTGAATQTKEPVCKFEWKDGRVVQTPEELEIGKFCAEYQEFKVVLSIYISVGCREPWLDSYSATFAIEVPHVSWQDNLAGETMLFQRGQFGGLKDLWNWAEDRMLTMLEYLFPHSPVQRQNGFMAIKKTYEASRGEGSSIGSIMRRRATIFKAFVT